VSLWKFSRDLPYLLRSIPTSLLVVGDFNSLLSNMDATGHQNYSRALYELMRWFELVHVGNIPRARHLYTLHQWGLHGLIYTPRAKWAEKKGAEKRFAAFTDNLAVVVRITLKIINTRLGHSYLKMNTA
jgi:hypothetical protein